MQAQWSMRFEGEEVKVVALGNAWVAAITSLNFLRIYSEGGLQVCHINIINFMPMIRLQFYNCKFFLTFLPTYEVWQSSKINLFIM